MEKDLRSYKIHNVDYETEKKFYSKEAIISRTEKTKDFERTGFGVALALTKNLPKKHIDIGSGVGWLIRKMLPYFDTSVGIEPSAAAIASAKNLLDGSPSVTFLNCDMIDGLNQLKLTEPAFFTTGAVFSHIENYYVEAFLKLLNQAPMGSVLYFSENYDRNIDWNMWHIRNKEWWRRNLSNWQIIFFDLDIEGYSSGIYGIKLENRDLLPAHKRTLLWRIFWWYDGVVNIVFRIIKKIKRALSFGKKSS